uniref:Cleavage and polyadenylation specificity factor subunit 5 n=1 Tax=Percolomonas cosmopolitus TaxID=63605 RepID=A0A7S1PJ78_9EUKA|mmetsp:Transcript_8805/g.32566  ORF Transcript_8805/g.32566 Transcript_8805/m.32566 type:complete len:205 (+) Transcript_8805:166-780(+)|eukprot:CAMPEP_0117451428 /NCGR_PEP_ID=MMETSP0759-20121206/9000_1 /TAXON_ID=63605 /ORGANISM="Percolomonas cosmopolitus, Strain WS" /LENGTH=204 /DNA_ID=CAMNT_0005244023 /DNA_START=134 /DNA_END=748 /DNA_ORIENTATION=+
MTELGQHKVIDLYDISNYQFGNKARQLEKDRSVTERMERMRREFPEKGVKRTVDAVVVVHKHNHPHLLLLQIGNEKKGFFKLPGGKAQPNETDEEAMLRKVKRKLAPDEEQFQSEWKVGDCLSVWYRPNFDTQMYPYKPAHITKPKEIKKLFLVTLPDQCMFQIPQNFNFLAVPFFEIYDNTKRYGPIIASIPQMLSKFHFNYK